MQIYKQFTFEAAHYLPSAAPGSANARIHGHSFRARVTVAGEPDADTGYIVHFDALAAAMEDARAELDHRLLNDLPGLTVPTLERLAEWLWVRLDNRVPGLASVEIARDSCGEGCVYTGPRAPRRLAAE
jgi:6-pyruvoyltetrahydropterin/6-carboxytetrahydropterin synthase